MGDRVSQLVADTPEDRWEVFDRGGRWLATLLIPQSLRVFDIGDDYVIGLVSDEMDVPFIHVYSLLSLDRPDTEGLMEIEAPPGNGVLPKPIP